MKPLYYLNKMVVLSLMVLYGNNVSAAECEQWPQHPEWLWCDDFEDEKPLSEKYQDVSSNGFARSGDDKFDGTYSLCQLYTPGQVDAGWVIRVDNSGFPEHLFYRWYHKFEKGFTGFPPKMARVRYRMRSGDWSSSLALHCWIDKGFVVADVAAKTSTQANSSGWLPVAVSSFSFDSLANMGRWVCFEMEVQLNTPGKNDGLYRVWADNLQIIERLNVDLRGIETYKLNEVMLDCYWNGGSPKEQRRYYDNFVISTQRIGMMAGSTVRQNRLKKSVPAIIPSVRPELQGMDGSNPENVPKLIVREENGKNDASFDLQGNRIVK
jgi:hypothetical protein